MEYSTCCSNERRNPRRGLVNVSVIPEPYTPYLASEKCFVAKADDASVCNQYLNGKSKPYSWVHSPRGCTRNAEGWEYYRVT